jgi:hypothetical protein
MAYTEFSGEIVREVTMKASDPSVSDWRWVLRMTPDGVEMHRVDEDGTFFLSWRSIIGHAMIHRAGRKGQVT